MILFTKVSNLETMHINIPPWTEQHIKIGMSNMILDYSVRNFVSNYKKELILWN